MKTVTIPLEDYERLLEDYERLQEQLQEYKDNYAYSNVHTCANGHYVFFRSKEYLDAGLTDEIKILEKRVEEWKEFSNRIGKELWEIKDTVNCSKRLFGYRLVKEKHLG